MVLERLLRDERARQREFPIVRRCVFLAHAAVSPLPRRVAEALKRHAESAQHGQETDYSAVLSRARKLAARLLRGAPDEIAFVSSTCAGLNLVAHGLDWRPGDEVVFDPDDFAANVEPWWGLRRLGVVPRPVRPERYGAVEPRDIARVVGRRTRLVALSSGHFLTGHRLDVAGVAAVCRRAGALLCLDAAQTMGVVREDAAAGADFIAAPGYKWLLGPVGVGLLWVRRKAQALLRPGWAGWANVRPGPAGRPRPFIKGGARYEPGALNAAGLAGLCAALELLSEAGLARVERRAARGARLLREGLLSGGWRVLGDDRAGACVSFRAAGGDSMRPLHRRLASAGLETSLREDARGREHIRLAPHFYNTPAELESALGLIGASR